MREMKDETLLAINLCDLKKKGIEMIKEFKAILESHGVEFWIEYGTLLGAVRDGKIIPWDSEFDCGLFSGKFPDKEKILIELGEKGFDITIAPDRLKIIKKDWEIGMFSIDLHLYRIDKNDAVLSFAKPVWSPYDNILWLVSLFDYSTVVFYRYGDIVKLLCQKFDVFDKDKFPNRIDFQRGPFNNLRSFKLHGEGFCLERRPTDAKTSIFGILIMNLLGSFPSPYISFIRKALTWLAPETRYEKSEQRIPLHFFNDLTTIELCGLVCKAPREKEKYLELVYGKGWQNPNPKWQREEMGIVHKTYE